MSFCRKKLTWLIFLAVYKFICKKSIRHILRCLCVQLSITQLLPISNLSHYYVFFFKFMFMFSFCFGSIWFFYASEHWASDDNVYVCVYALKNIHQKCRKNTKYTDKIFKVMKCICALFIVYICSKKEKNDEKFVTSVCFLRKRSLIYVSFSLAPRSPLRSIFAL